MSCYRTDTSARGRIISAGILLLFLSLIFPARARAQVAGDTPITADTRQNAPTAMLTEWHGDGAVVSDPYPDFHWQFPRQSACQVVLHDVEDRIWDSGKVPTPVTVVEYAGPPLREGVTYHWRVRAWGADGPSDWSAPTTFQYRHKPRPMVNPHIRTFMNFGGSTEFAVANLDLTFRSEPNQVRPSILALNYSLLATMVIPSEKADALEQFCIERGLTENGISERMFCHFRTDTKVTLHVGAERANNPRETRNCPGWDPANDRNGDGRVDDTEAADPANPDATARRMKQARIPIYYWGPPRDDFVMNIGNHMYQTFLAEVYCPGRLPGYDGLYIDTTPTDVPAAGRHANVLEFPRPPENPHQWLHAMRALMAKIKINMPDNVITANGWRGRPLVIDGLQSEGWMRIGTSVSQYERILERTAAMDRRGKIQMIQYNPIFHEKHAEFGEKLPISHDRDAIFGLATYYLIHGDYTYYGFGRHPYAHVQELWPEAAAVDIGTPTGPYRVFAEHEVPAPTADENLLPNGDFERGPDPDGNPDQWTIAEPVQLDERVVHSGQYSACITSNSPQINNINKCYVTLKPHSSYTLICWMKTDEVVGEPGAQVYPYEFEGASGGGMITVTSTTDWKRYMVSFRTADDPAGRINFRIYGATGSAWFDDIALIQGAAAGWKVFAREFEDALVLAKPYCGGDWGDSAATDHALPTALRPLNADGSLGRPIDVVNLRSGEAAILLKQ